MPEAAFAASTGSQGEARLASIIGFDFGEKRIGVAIGNRLTGGARPLSVIEVKTRDQRFAAIGALLEAWTPDLLIVGSPDPGSRVHPIALRCQRFANQLEGRFGLPVILVDERLSSAEAERLRGESRKAVGFQSPDAKRRGPIDAWAAAVILQQYLDELTTLGR